MQSSSIPTKNINVVLVSFASSLLVPDSEITSYMHETVEKPKINITYSIITNFHLLF